MAQKTIQLTPEERIKRFDEQQKRYVGPDAILVLHEKHGDIYFAIPTVEVLYEVALNVVKGRLEEGWYYEPEEPTTDKEFTPEEIEKIKKSSYGETFIEQYESHQKDIAQYQEDLYAWKELHEAIENKDGRKAWPLIRDHKDYEYEGWEIAHLTKPEEYR